jgi:MinD superfamily P-loop ATPase
VRIAIASGKGGTGKTTVATSLALSVATGSPDSEVMFLDCDVEAPNAHLFLNPTLEHREEVGILLPEVDEARCTFCGRCAEVCQFHAIAVIGQKTLVFPELCHGCGGCTLECPQQAISEVLAVLGVLEAGPAAEGIRFAHGIMNVGQPMAVPIISQLKKRAAEMLQWPEVEGQDGRLIVLDVSPGTSCPVVEAVSGADFALLVTEPTPFGLHDLRLMFEVTKELGIPVGVVINREGVGDTGVEEFCAEAGLPVLMRIPLDRQIAEGIARGRPLVAIQAEYVGRFRELYRRIRTLVQEGRR